MAEFPDLLRRLKSRLTQVSKPRVYVAGSSGEPTQMLETLLARPDAAEQLHFIQFPLPGINQFDFTALSQTTEHSVFFMSAALKDANPERLHFIPIHMRRVYDYLLEHPVDIALIQVALDRHGTLRILSLIHI